jgi:hypothetical protein
MKNKSGILANQSSQFDTKIHTNQISEYLPLLNNKALELINKSQEKTDSLIPVYGGQYSNYYHFDNNKLSESTQKINEGYRNALESFSSSPDDIFIYFGRITHALQDFYSHSNWYELSKAGFTQDQRLLDEGYGFFQELRPLQAIGSTRVVALEKGFRDPITAWGKVEKWMVNPDTYVVSGKTEDGFILGGLMTGEVNGLLYGSGKSVEITDPITNRTYPGFDHGGLAGTISGKFLGPLAKDKADDRYHTSVLELARDQIQHELVRLLSLIQGQYGNKGLYKFSNLFVRDGHQDEFKDLIQSRDLTLGELTKKEILNTRKDNVATDNILDDFFRTGDPDVKVKEDDHPLPNELKEYSQEIAAGDFRWIPAITPGAGPDDYVLAIHEDGKWTATTFTSDQFTMFR